MKYFPVLLLFVAVHAWAGDYYVADYGSDESGIGSADQPWASIQRAADSVGPGSTIHVAPGVYTQPIVTQTSGTSDDVGRITFISDTPYGAQIRNSEAAQWIDYGDYVDIVGFDISGADSPLGILVLGSYVRVLGNHVHDLCQNIAFDQDGCAGIDQGNYGAVGNETTNNLIHDIGPQGTQTVWAHGIYHAMSGGSIVYNVVYRVTGYGIHLWHAANQVTIANNTIAESGTLIPAAGASMGGAILVGSGDDGSSAPVDNCVVSNNVVYDNPGVGIREYGWVGANNSYVGNTVYNNDPDWMLITGYPQ